MRYVIGDIHGCFDKMLAAISNSGFDASKGDILYSVGDFCDRGDNSSAVLNYIYLLNKNYPGSFKAVFGNHDIWLYQYWDDKFNHNLINKDAWECWDYNGGKKTLRSIKGMDTNHCKELFKWLGDLPYRIELDDFIIQHTTTRCELLNGYDPNKITLKQCMNEDICGKDYDSWFWDRNVLMSSRVLNEGREGKNISNIKYTPTDKPLIIGHTPIVDGPLIDKYLNIISIDTAIFVTAEAYDTPVDGEACVLNLDTMEWFKSNGVKGSFKENK